MRSLKENKNCFHAITFVFRLLVSNRFTLHFQVYLTVEMNKTKERLDYQKEKTSYII